MVPQMRNEVKNQERPDLKLALEEKIPKIHLALEASKKIVIPSRERLDIPILGRFDLSEIQVPELKIPSPLLIELN